MEGWRRGGRGGQRRLRLRARGWNSRRSGGSGLFLPLPHGHAEGEPERRDCEMRMLHGLNDKGPRAGLQYLPEMAGNSSKITGHSPPEKDALPEIQERGSGPAHERET